MGKGVPWEGIDYFAGGYIDRFRYELSMSSLTNGFILTFSFFGELGVHDSPIVKRLKRKNVHHSSNIFEAWLATVKVSWNFSYKNHGFHSVENLRLQVTTHKFSPDFPSLGACVVYICGYPSLPPNDPESNMPPEKTIQVSSVFFLSGTVSVLEVASLPPVHSGQIILFIFDEGHFTKT